MIGWFWTWLLGAGWVEVTSLIESLWKIVEEIQNEFVGLGFWFYVAAFGIGVLVLALAFGAGFGILIVLTNITGFLVAIGAVEAALTDLDDAQKNAETAIDQTWVDFVTYIQYEVGPWFEGAWKDIEVNLLYWLYNNNQAESYLAKKAAIAQI